MKLNCPACNGKEFEFWKNCKAQHIQNSDYKLFQCKDCRHVQAIGNVENATLSEIYSEPFFSTSAQNNSPKSPARKNSQSRAKRLSATYSPKLTLDLGAGIGLFVSEMNKYCPTIGAEFSGHAVEKAKQLSNNVTQLDFTKSLSEIEKVLNNEVFDLITLWDVASCFEDQSDVFTKIFSLCNDNSNVVVTIPLYDSIAAKIMGKYWPFWIPPVNQHYYTYNSIEAILNHAGFRITQFNRRGKYVSLDFLIQKLVRSLGFAIRPKSLAFFSTIHLPINTFDIAEVHMEKSVERK